MAAIVKRTTKKDANKTEKKVRELEEKSPIECLLNEDNSDNIVLYSGENKRTVFEQVAVIPIETKIYAILKPVDKLPEMEDDQALVFVIEEIDGEDCLMLVEDDKLIDIAFEKYYDLLRKEGLIK